MTASIAMPGAAGSDLAANAAGTILVVGEANSGGGGAVQRRDPATGAVLASHPMLGLVAPSVAGLIDSGVWVSQATGMMGYVERLTVATLAPEPGTRVGGGNGISARVAGGLLWVTGAGAQARSYCADPSDGRMLAPIELPQPAQDEILAIGRHRIFYATPGPAGSQYLHKQAIPGHCRVRRQRADTGPKR